MLAHFGTRTLASLTAAHERLTSLEDQRLDLLTAYAEHDRDLGMGLISQLEQSQSRTLILRQPLHIGEQVAQLLASLHLDQGSVAPAQLIEHTVAADRFASRAQVGDAAIARDRVQPWPQRDLLLVAPTQRTIRSDERQLKRILPHVSASQQMHAEREHPGGITIVNRLEGEVVSSPYPCYQLLVAVGQRGPTLERAAESKAIGNYRHERSMHRP
jgi:hypothetical protein